MEGWLKKEEEQSMENKEIFDSKFVFLQKRSVHFVAGRSGSSTARRLPIIYRCFSCFVG